MHFVFWNQLWQKTYTVCCSGIYIDGHQFTARIEDAFLPTSFKMHLVHVVRNWAVVRTFGIETTAHSLPPATTSDTTCAIRHGLRIVFCPRVWVGRGCATSTGPPRQHRKQRWIVATAHFYCKLDARLAGWAMSTSLHCAIRSEWDGPKYS